MLSNTPWLAHFCLWLATQSRWRSCALIRLRKTELRSPVTEGKKPEPHTYICRGLYSCLSLLGIAHKCVMKYSLVWSDSMSQKTIVSKSFISHFKNFWPKKVNGLFSPASFGIGPASSWICPASSGIDPATCKTVLATCQDWPSCL